MDNSRSDELIQKVKCSWVLPTLKCQLKGQMKEILPQWLLLQTVHVALIAFFIVLKPIRL